MCGKLYVLTCMSIFHLQTHRTSFPMAIDTHWIVVGRRWCPLPPLLGWTVSHCKGGRRIGGDPVWALQCLGVRPPMVSRRMKPLGIALAGVGGMSLTVSLRYKSLVLGDEAASRRQRLTFQWEGTTPPRHLVIMGRHRGWAVHR